MKESSKFNLQMLNLWLGLCRGDTGLPSDIRSLGYRDKWIEFAFSTKNGDKVNPELIITSFKTGHTILFEWKHGDNTDSDQLRRYSEVTSNDLNSKAAIPGNECKLHDVCLIGLSEHFERLQLGLTNSGLPFPLLVLTDEGIEKKLNSFVISDLNQVFNPKLAFNPSLIPTQLVPFDRESEDWEIAEHIMPNIVIYMITGEPSFSLDQLARDSMSIWNVVLAPFYKGELRNRIKRIVNAASDFEFRGYFQKDKKITHHIDSAVWKITYDATKLPFDKRSQESRKLKTLQTEFIHALQTGERKPHQANMDDYLNKIIDD
jgi:hypothetical protein